MPGDCDKGTVLVEFRFESVLCDIDADALAQMVCQCWRSNLRSGVTGEMRIEDRRVAQVIEGAIDVVLPMVARILSDRRHTEIETITLGPIVARRFGDWRIHGMQVAAAVPADAAGAIALFPSANALAAAIAVRRTA